MIIGAQLYTVRKQCDTLEHLDESLKRCADMGYKAVQLSGICEYEAGWMKEKLEKYGLIAPITHISFKRITEDTDNVIAEHKIFGADYVGLGSVPDFKKSGCDPVVLDDAFEKLAPAIEKIHAAGLKFMYHNHNMEFSRTSDGEVVIDKIARKFSPAMMGITLDTYWVTAGGGDPAWWLRHLAGRLDCVHFKDMVYSGEDQAVRMAPIGRGNMNYPEILKACADAGVRYAFVEQDNCYGENTFDCLKESLDNLRALGARD
ncbi:MAG: sugar phosphate isomerase/epimerase [Clostridia bacterium]|nr:sugar phosphate isomerase/epimerase [Clostridia bacterium]